MFHPTYNSHIGDPDKQQSTTAGGPNTGDREHKMPLRRTSHSGDFAAVATQLLGGVFATRRKHPQCWAQSKRPHRVESRREPNRQVFSVLQWTRLLWRNAVVIVRISGARHAILAPQFSCVLARRRTENFDAPFALSVSRLRIAFEQVLCSAAVS